MNIVNFAGNCSGYIMYGFGYDNTITTEGRRAAFKKQVIAALTARRGRGFISASTNQYQKIVGSILKECGFTGVGPFRSSTGNMITVWTLPVYQYDPKNQQALADKEAAKIAAKELADAKALAKKAAADAKAAAKAVAAATKKVAGLKAKKAK